MENAAFSQGEMRSRQQFSHGVSSAVQSLATAICFPAEAPYRSPSYNSGKCQWREGGSPPHSEDQAGCMAKMPMWRALHMWLPRWFSWFYCYDSLTTACFCWSFLSWIFQRCLMRMLAQQRSLSTASCRLVTWDIKVKRGKPEVEMESGLSFSGYYTVFQRPVHWTFVYNTKPPEAQLIFQKP